MKKFTFLPILLLFLNMNCEKNPDSGQENLWMPTPLKFSLYNMETGANLIFGDSASYSPDSIRISLSDHINYVPVDYDTLRGLISLDYPVLPGIDEKSWFLKFNSESIDTIVIRLKDIKSYDGNGALSSAFSYSVTFLYNEYVICDSCDLDSVYKIKN